MNYQIFKQKIIKNWLCIIFLIASFALTMYALLFYNPIDNTLSDVGRANRVWFFFWGFTTCLALYFNLNYMTMKFKINNKIIDKVLDIVAIIASFCVLMVGCVVGIAGDEVSVVFHWSFAITFAVLSVAYIFFIIIYQIAKGNKIFIAPLAFLIIAGAIDLGSIFFIGLSALCELPILLACEVAMYVINTHLRAKGQAAALNAEPAAENADKAELQ